MSAAKRARVVNEFAGFRPAPAFDFRSTAVTMADLSPRAFFEDYVKQRQPVLIKGHIDDERWKGEQWTNAYMREKVKAAQVKVERRQNVRQTFGRGDDTCVRMSFSSFLDLFESGDQMHYMTTQDLDTDDNGRPLIVSAPVTQLLEDLPLQPKLTGNLIPQNINLWMGNSKDGSSSGLHHDYHDNLYLLLRGSKRFRLFSPADAEHLYTTGELLKVHPNGRINYKGQPTCSDGSDEKAMAAMDAASATTVAEQKVAEAEEAVRLGESGAAERLQAAEEELEAALDAAVNAEFDDEWEDGEEGGEAEDGDEDDEEMGGLTTANLFPPRKAGAGEGTGGQPSGRGQVEPGTGATESGSGGSGSGESPTRTRTQTPPPNFSSIDLSLARADLLARFPAYAQARCFEVTVAAGESLYLPAGWFHDVTSMNTSTSANDTSKGEGAQAQQEHAGHMALNYWFHPPDGQSFERPYQNDFWPRDWELREDGGKA